jgi:L-iditol 2-dehydrogenase
VVLHALEPRGGVRMGRPVAICGAGPIGLTSLTAVRASGAWSILITDVEEKRLEFARGLVEGYLTYRVRTELEVRENAKEIRQLIGVGKGDERGVSENEYEAPALVLECTGVEDGVATAAYTCRRGGIVVAVEVGKATMNKLPFMHLSLAEVCKTSYFLNSALTKSGPD